eukprot:109591-Hanusia_phi.AAC.2
MPISPLLPCAGIASRCKLLFQLCHFFHQIVCPFMFDAPACLHREAVSSPSPLLLSSSCSCSRAGSFSRSRKHQGRTTSSPAPPDTSTALISWAVRSMSKGRVMKPRN